MEPWNELWASTTFRVLCTIAALLIVQMAARQFLSQIVRRVVRSHHYPSAHEERQREDTLVTIFRTASAVMLWIVGVIVVLSELHVKIAPLLTSAGVISVVVGFGAQKTIKDFLAGVFIILENQYRVGDIITVNGGASGSVSGSVESITIRITRLRDLDGALHIVQNGDIGVVTNLSFGFSNVNIDVPVAYDADIAKVAETINKVGSAIAADEVWRDSIVEPIRFLRVESFGQSAVNIKALGKVKPGEQFDVAGAFRRQLMVAFEKAGIEIPLPQRVIHKA